MTLEPPENNPPIKSGDRALVRTLLEALSALRRRIESDDPLVLDLACESFLHPVSLRLSLCDWLETIKKEQLYSLLATARAPRRPLPVLTLAPGNLPILASECLILGLLAGVRHTLALSTRATGLAKALEKELVARIPSLSDRLELVVWRHLTNDQRHRILSRSARVVVYGTADTVDWIARQAPPHAVLVPHGPGLAVAYLDPALLTPDELSVALAGLARDVALYDQRGCRSPHILFLQGSDQQLDQVRDLLVSVHLPAIQSALPRGPSYVEETSAMFLDRLTSRSLGEVYCGDRFCLTVERSARIARPSPLGRTLRLIGFRHPSELAGLLQSTTIPVTLIGTFPEAFSPLDPGGPQPEISLLGQLGMPVFNRLHDGRHRLDEYRG
ncbi:MAG: hypothetical protein JW797_04635 [Bradymonadales bacterium]|nr:hypothetical protein [Bradymonadales bacterium]